MMQEIPHDIQLSDIGSIAQDMVNGDKVTFVLLNMNPSRESLKFELTRCEGYDGEIAVMTISKFHGDDEDD